MVRYGHLYGVIVCPGYVGYLLHDQYGVQATWSSMPRYAGTVGVRVAGYSCVMGRGTLRWPGLPTTGVSGLMTKCHRCNPPLQCHKVGGTAGIGLPLACRGGCIWSTHTLWFGGGYWGVEA